MDIPKNIIEQYLPTVEGLLTSILLEETEIEIDTFERVESELALEGLNDTDIYLFTREQQHSSDAIVVLDKEWFGLLSSIMLGIEEKEKNDKTIGLLKEFSDDLSDVIAEKALENSIELDLNDAEVFSKEEVREELNHEEYFWVKLEIAGIADEKVRAEFLLGDPDTEIEREVPEAEESDAAEREVSTSELSSMDATESEEEFSTLDTNSKDKETVGKKEEVVSARHIEFAEFSDENGAFDGDSHSMDLLKDVELDVSVELGRIELPLGKVLQLAKGSVIELEKLAGEPVDILVNGNRIALGEVVVIDEHFGVRISSLVTTKKRLAKIKNGS